MIRYIQRVELTAIHTHTYTQSNLMFTDFVDLNVHVGYNSSKTGHISHELSEPIDLNDFSDADILDLVWEDYQQLSASLAQVMFFELERENSYQGKINIYVNYQH